MLVSNDKLVSVAISLYRSSHLDTLLETLKNQTYLNVEYILSVDSVDDNEIIDFTKKMSDYFNNVKIFMNPQPLGARGNYDHCFDMSSGDYFMRLDDDDDLSRPTHIETLARKLDDGYDFVLANVNVEMWCKGKYISTRTNTMKSYENNRSKFDFSKSSIDETAMIFYAMFNMDKLKVFYPDLRKSDDNVKHFFEGLFTHKVALSLNGIYVPDEVYIFRVTDESMSQQASIEEYCHDYINYLKKAYSFFVIESDFNLFEKLFLTMKLMIKTSSTLLYYIVKKYSNG